MIRTTWVESSAVALDHQRISVAPGTIGVIADDEGNGATLAFRDAGGRWCVSACLTPEAALTVAEFLRTVRKGAGKS